MRLPLRWMLCGWVALSACGSDGPGRTSFEDGSDPTLTASGTGDSDTDTSTGTSKGTSNPSGDDDDGPTTGPTDSSDSETDADTETDTDDPSTTSGLEVQACIGVDVLFVIDNSVGMLEEQARLVATANAFVNMLVPMVPSAMSDVNIGVITSDDAQLVVPIDGVTMMPTTYASGENYMTYATFVAEELNTAISVGEGGHPNERPMDFLVEALTGDVADAGGFNDGFLREDALLVVVLLTDEEDDFEMTTEYGSAGDPQDWVDGVASVKGGIKRDIAVLSIIPAGDACTSDGDAERLAEFTTSFGHGAVAEVCEPEYSTFLVGRIGDLAAACTNFSPP